MFKIQKIVQPNSILLVSQSNPSLKSVDDLRLENTKSEGPQEALESSNIISHRILINLSAFNPSDGANGLPLDVFNANMGYLVHLLSLLSYYLHVRLPFPLENQGSESTINHTMGSSQS